MARIGVFVCWCGANIAETVDVDEVARYAGGLPGVVTASSYKYMCSDPGQRLITDAIREHRLSAVVVASCSPRMHEATFRKTAAAAGLNPYTVEVANIREHCSWVHNNREEATEKAEDLVRLAVERVKRNVPLREIETGVTRRVMVIGAGIAGIQAALDIAAAGCEVVLVEREPAIGGHMAQLDETFPTLDCSQCILTPRMVEIAHHDKIRLYTYSEIEKVEGYVGNFEVTVRKRARSVDASRCTGCGRCSEKCPTKVTSEFDLGLRTRKAIYVPFPQAVPNVPVIDRENCRYYRTGKCRVCEKVCEAGAIAFDQQDEIVTEKVGAIVVATGYGILDPSVFEDYGFGKYPDVVTSAQFERMVSASGPSLGELRRPSNGEPPKTIVFLQCIGSREEEGPGKPYCSKICCMYTAKHTILYKHKVPDGQAFVFYMDVRAGGKNYEEFVRRVVKEKTATYLRGGFPRYSPRGQAHRARGRHAERCPGGDRRGHGRARGGPGALGRRARACPEATHRPRPARLPQRGAPQAAPRGDKHGGHIPGRRVPWPKGHP